MWDVSSAIHASVLEMPPIGQLLAMPPETIWGVFVRLLSLIYVVAFFSLRAEILPLAGSRGINPIGGRLVRIRADFGAWHAFTRYPTLLWLADSDPALRLLPLAGALSAMLAAFGIASRPMLAVAWVIYLSMDSVFGLTYPWESMLFETGFLAILLPPLQALPALSMTRAPEPILMFAFHWLLFRVLFGFGKTKFTRDALADPLYMRGFLISQPMPSPLGWLAARLPRRLLTSTHSSMFIIEIALPFLVFFSGLPRLVAAAGFTALMIGIQVMGNFGFFNMLTAILCITLLDGRSVTAQTLAPFASPHGIAVLIAIMWSLLAGLCHLPFNTWVARGWVEWPIWGAVRGPGGALLGVLRAAMPFRTVHAYGVFPPRIGPPAKFIPVVEGTLDGVNWETFEYRYMPSTEMSPPRFVAPHCPRLDHLVMYEGAGATNGNYLDTIFSKGSPYDFSNATILERLLERLMEPDSVARDLFRVVPFEGRPPIRMRIRTYMFTPTTPKDARATGRYWHCDLIAEDFAERSPDLERFQRWLPSPEQFHPDERWARRRVPRLRPLLSARSLDDTRSVLDATALSLWDKFWDAFIPDAQCAAEEGWTAILALAQRVETQYGASGVKNLDCILGAVSTALLERMEPQLFGLAQPQIKVRTYFHASLLAHSLVLGGRARTEEALANSPGLPNGLTPDTEKRGLMLLTLLRRNTMILHAQKHRLMTAVFPPSAPNPDTIPGFHFQLPVLAEALPDPNERIPHVQQRSDGEWTLDGIEILKRK